MNSFLHDVTDELLRRFGWDGLKDVTLVFPMHRAGVVMRSELQQRMAAENVRSVWAPEMMALGDLFDRLCPLGKEDEVFTVCRLYRIYSKCLRQLPPTARGAIDIMDIDRFYGWGRQLLSDFTNIDQGISESEIDSFFRNALSLSDLDRYKLDDEVRHRLEDLLYKGEARRQSLITQSVQAHFAAMWQAMPDIYKRLREQMQHDGKGYDGQRMRYVVSHWPELRTRAASKTYCFIGFNYLLPVERRLMQLLKDEERALFFWDYVEDFQSNSKAFAFIRQNIRMLPNVLPAVHWGAPRTVRAVSATSVHSEAEYAGQWLKQVYREKGERTAVVICDEGQLEAVIYGLPPIQPEGSDVPEEINITKGYPLRNTVVFAEVMKELDKSFRRKALSPVQALQHAVDFVDAQSGLSIAARQNTWQWHLGREALYQTRRALMQFIHILNDGLVGDLADHPELLRRLVTRHLEQVSLPFHGEPVTDLQVMGVLETRTLDFKHLLLLNVEEGVIPAHQPDKSFLPYYLRKAYGLQTHDERASVYAYNFFRLLNRADDVTLVFSQSQTAMTKKTMSRFLMQMLVCPDEFVVKKFVLTEGNTLQAVNAVVVPPDTSWQAMLEQEGRDLKLSPSAINTFYECKRRFYLSCMLGYDEEDEPETIFSNRTMGLFVHEALLYLYSHHCGCDNKSEVSISPNMVERMNTSAHRDTALRNAYDRLNADYISNHQGVAPIYQYEQHELENHIMDTYIRSVLDRDQYDAEHRGLTIVMLEQSQYATVDGVAIGGRIDRMDRVGGRNGFPEVTRIVDYKTGNYKKSKMSATAEALRKVNSNEANYVRQTLIYSSVVYAKGLASSIEPHLYFTSLNLTDGNNDTRVSLGGKTIVYDGDRHEEFSGLIRDMIKDIRDEREFPQCDSCQEFCPFLRLCKRKPSKW